MYKSVTWKTTDPGSAVFKKLGKSDFKLLFSHVWEIPISEAITRSTVIDPFYLKVMYFIITIFTTNYF